MSSSCVAKHRFASVFKYRCDEFGLHITMQGSVLTLYGEMVQEIYGLGSRGETGKQAQVSYYFLIGDGYFC